MSEDSIRVTAGRPGASATDTPGRRGGLPVPSEVIVLAATVLAVLIAAAVDDGFGSTLAWPLVTVLAASYIFSRGLVKRGHGDDGL